MQTFDKKKLHLLVVNNRYRKLQPEGCRAERRKKNLIFEVFGSTMIVKKGLFFLNINFFFLLHFTFLDHNIFCLVSCVRTGEKATGIWSAKSEERHMQKESGNVGARESVEFCCSCSLFPGFLLTQFC